MRIKNIKEIDPVLSRCIEVDSSDRLFGVKTSSGQTVTTHNSVSQRNIILGCIL
jgi:hypothetical protein